MHLQMCGPEQVQLTHANRQNAYIKTQGVLSGSRWPDALERYCWVSLASTWVEGGRARKPHPPGRHMSTNGGDGWEKEGVVRV